jgi:hypothetical protein
MRHNDQQLGVPETIFKGLKADIEVAYAIPGMVAYATDTGKLGYCNGSEWVWEQTDAHVDTHGAGGDDKMIEIAASEPATTFPGKLWLQP